MLNCKGPKGEPGPGGEPFKLTEESLIEGKEGYIKGALTTNVEGVPTTYNIDFQGNYILEYSSFTKKSEELTEINIEKYYAKDGEQFKSANISLRLAVKSLKDLKDATLERISFYGTKSLSPNKILDINFSGDDFGSTGEADVMNLSELKYDSTTQVIEGKFDAVVNYRRYLDNGVESKIVTSTIQNGSFKSKLVQVVQNGRQ
ncbi:MAG TPA: hypothetical protein VF691_12330 [Cytophagaceae bacterium]